MATRVQGNIGEKYALSAVLGEGTTGTVYAAKNLRTGRRVAIKSLRVGSILDPGNPELLRFEQEARIAGSLESEHIAQVLDIERDPATDIPFLVMELLRGEDLQSLLDRVGPLPVDVALRIAAQACAGLAAAHAAGVVHRDVKPGNVFLARREGGEIVVKILDFGLAKIRRLPPDGSTSAASSALSAPQQSMTETGQLLGSPLYMSPEQLDGAKGVDARSDLFSLAVTLFAMLAGKPPHADVKSFPLLLSHIASKPMPKVREVAAEVGPLVEALLERASRLEREERFGSATAMLEAMTPLLPGGTALREDMLVGRGDAPREVVMTHVESDPRVMAERAAAEERAPAKTADASRPRRWLVRIGGAVFVVMAVAAALVILGR
ncbi:serine/threonine-protein kinase [Polyangium sorediatum]|uniref:Serine/threonine-protein kinase n=1 Tax=Polyangium sorediatum TaxID=889274 RepID=A0ABT6NX43_9BACT|nr:serine/threonine-protein kinase [Polyangium sorediatum]MDI1432914.1 serine/threonine-protein kinase [Polyangium sorediatum]